MKLTLGREDLKTDFKNINCSQTRFEHFKQEVQNEIIAVGRATFKEDDGSNYNVIFQPENRAA